MTSGMLPHELRQYRERLLASAESTASHVDRLAEHGQRTAASLRAIESSAASTASHLDRLGAHGQRTAASLSAIEWSAESTAADVARLASVVDSAVPAIIDQLAVAAERLGGVEDLLANPSATASAELYRRGSYALAAGWLEEATGDLTRAVETFPYSPLAWFNLGVAHGRQDQTEVAANAFHRCARYGAAKSPDVAASAVLLAASLQRSLGDAEKSAQLLREFVAELDLCAEIHLALAVHHGDRDQLRRALELAPVLAADARVAGAESAERVAAEQCTHRDGPVARLRALEAGVAELLKALASTTLSGVRAAADPIELPPAGITALLRANAAIPVALETSLGIIKEVEAAQRQLDADAAAAQRQSRELQDELRRQPRISDRAADERTRQSNAAEEAVKRDGSRRIEEAEREIELATSDLATAEREEKELARMLEAQRVFAQEGRRLRAETDRLERERRQCLEKASENWDENWMIKLIKMGARASARERAHELERQWDEAETKWRRLRELATGINAYPPDDAYSTYMDSSYSEGLAQAERRAQKGREGVARARTKFAQREQDAKRIRNETTKRCEAIRRDLKGELARVEKAARGQAAALRQARLSDQRAAEAMRRAQDAQAALEKPIAELTAAIQAGRPARRITPFSVPGQLSLIAETGGENRGSD
jgi:hypothetical protein